MFAASISSSLLLGRNYEVIFQQQLKQFLLQPLMICQQILSIFYCFFSPQSQNNYFRDLQS